MAWKRSLGLNWEGEPADIGASRSLNSRCKERKDTENADKLMKIIRQYLDREMVELDEEFSFGGVEVFCEHIHVEVKCEAWCWQVQMFIQIDMRFCTVTSLQ